MQKKFFLMAGALSCVASAATLAASGSVMVKQLAPTSVTPDYANAKPMPLPRTQAAPTGRATAQAMPARSSRLLQPGFAPGARGDGVQTPERVLPAGFKRAPSKDAGVAPEQAGKSDHVFTTSRANIESMKPASAYPYTATGRLFFNIGADTYVCSASLIGPGLVVTAAHCVSGFGTNAYYDSFQYIPDYSEGKAPFGVWSAVAALAPTKYLDGTTTCSAAAPGVVCEDDVALLLLQPKGTKYPGTKTGWLGYGWDGAGFNKSDQVLITQLGYPVGLDNGELMQRNDSEGFLDPASANNTVIGSLMNGGSSGGPWVANWGVASKATGFLIKVTEHNTIVGVTSWGYTDPRINEQGAAPFLSTNIVPLVNTACAQVPAACATSN